MKSIRLFPLLSILLIALSAGCSNDTDSPRKDDEPAAPAFDLTVRNITRTSANITIKPQDKQMSYISFVAQQEFLDENGLDTDEALFDYDMEQIANYIHNFGGDLSDFLLTGDLIDWAYTDATGSTDYVAYVYGIDPLTEERLTDICYCEFRTPDLEMVEASFGVEAKAYGPIVELTITPEGYHGPYYFTLIEASALEPEASLFDVCHDHFAEVVSYYQAVYYYTLDDVLQSVCSRGTGRFRLELKPGTDYIACAYAVNDQAEVCSEPSSAEVTTGTVVASDNEIAIVVSNITATSARITVKPSNEDTYAAGVVKSSAIEGMTDEQIMEYLAAANPSTLTGSFWQELQLESQTEYTVYAFGYLAGTVTTELFRNDFKTLVAEEGTATFRLEYAYYDVAEVAALYPEWEHYHESGYEVMLLATAISDSPEYYYTINDPSIFEGASDDNVRNWLMTYGLSNKTITLFTWYDVTKFAGGFAVDDNGNRGPLWRDEIILSKEGVSDMGSFVNPQSRSVRSAAETDAAETVPEILFFGQPAAGAGQKAPACTGGAPVDHRPAPVELPEKRETRAKSPGILQRMRREIAVLSDPHRPIPQGDRPFCPTEKRTFAPGKSAVYV